MTTIQVVDARGSGWEDEIAKVRSTGRNFLVLIKSDPEALERICACINCSPEEMPERLGRWGIHALSDVLPPEQYEKLLKAQRGGDAVHFIEQLHLKTNRPPNLKRFMVYCDVRGIISHHDTSEEATTGFMEYLEKFRRTRTFLLVGIYAWRTTQWERLRTVF